MMLMIARSWNVDRLPDSSRNWINEKLIYTRIYGVDEPVNGFTPEGLPICCSATCRSEHDSRLHAEASGRSTSANSPTPTCT